MEQRNQNLLQQKDLKVHVSKIWHNYCNLNSGNYYELNKETIAETKSACFAYNLTEQEGFLSTIIFDYLKEKCEKHRSIKVATQDSAVLLGSYQGVKKFPQGVFSYAETHNKHLLKLEIGQADNKKHKREISLKDILAVYPQ